MEDIVISSIISNIFWAGIILIIGMIISQKVREVSQKFLEGFRLNQATKNLGWHHFFEKYNAKLNPSKAFGIIIQVYLLLITFMISSEILELGILSQFFLNIVEYYPNIFISSLIFIIAVFVAEFSKKIVSPEVGFKYSGDLSTLVSSTTWVLATLAILYQLQIVPDLVITLFVGVVAAIALAFGLAIGLGSQDLIKNHLKKVGKKKK